MKTCQQARVIGVTDIDFYLILDARMLVLKEPHSCGMLIKSKSVDYDGPFSFAVVLSESIPPKGYPLFQSPFDLDTRRKDVERPSKKGLILML